MFSRRSFPFIETFKIGAAAHRRVTGLVCLLALAWAGGVAHAERQDPAGAARAKVTADVVFRDPLDFVDRVKSGCQDVSAEKLQDCFVKEMKKAKAPAAAVEFSKQLGEPGFVREFKAAGPVDIAYVMFPYRANEQLSVLILNGEPPMVDVDNHKLVGADALKGNARFEAMAVGHKDVSLWPGDRFSEEMPDVEISGAGGGGARVVVNYRLREQCHACEVLGHAWFSFGFDGQGKFDGAAKVVAVTAPRTGATAAMVARDARKTIAMEVGEEVSVALPVARAASQAEWKLARGLDTDKVRLIEHTHVAPPTRSGAPGREEIWKFAGMGAGETEIEFQRVDGSGVEKFRVVVKG
jgi:chagasin family peptidase inhibitor I42